MNPDESQEAELTVEEIKAQQRAAVEQAAAEREAQRLEQRAQ